jgi:nucleoside-diphosphate-sugar epimerase
MDKYLITGGAGFIGSHLVDTLLEKGSRVVVLDNFSSGNWRNVETALNKGSDRLKIIEGDICDLETCREACEGVDYILHEAALGSISRSVEHPIQTHNNNANGTLNILIAARDAKVKRLVYASSSSIYGGSEILPRIESITPKPISPYAVSKLAGEHYCFAFFHTYGLETIVLRYFNVFGPRQNIHSQYAAVIPCFIYALLQNKQPTIFGDGEQSRDFTYISNVVDANLLAVSASREACGRAFNIGCGRKHSINDLYRMLKEIMKIDGTFLREPARLGDVLQSYANIDEAERWLHYRPTVDLYSGIQQTIKFFEKLVKSEEIRWK